MLKAERRLRAALLVALVGPMFLAAGAQAGDDDVDARLKGLNEVPVVLTDGNGDFEAELEDDVIEYELDYDDTKGEVLQAHIHLAQKGVNGPVAAFLCTNLGNAPPGHDVPPCDPEGDVEGEITPDEVLGIDAQGLEAGDIEALFEAMEDGGAYINVHSSRFPPGELRGQTHH